jgi:hypothetical protein
MLLAAILCPISRKAAASFARLFDKHEQRATRPTTLQPVMRAAVDLNQFAEPRPAGPRLKHSLLPPLFGLVQTKTKLNVPHRLARHHDAVPLRQFLRRQLQIRQAVVRPNTPLTRFKPGVAVLLPGAHKAFELTHADASTLRRFPLTKRLLNRRTDQVQPIPLIGTHQQTPFGHRTSPDTWSKGDILTLHEGDIPTLR